MGRIADGCGGALIAWRRDADQPMAAIFAHLTDYLA